MQEWHREQTIEKTSEFTRLGPTSVIQRRKFEELPETLDGKKQGYTCESRILTNAEYEQVRNQIEDVKRIVADITDTAKYEEGYNAAMILLGQEV